MRIRFHILRPGQPFLYLLLRPRLFCRFPASLNRLPDAGTDDLCSVVGKLAASFGGIVHRISGSVLMAIL